MAQTIGEKLKLFGSKHFKTKKAFAAALGMSYENLYQYLEDRAKPGADFLMRLKDLNCDINWLLEKETSTRSMKVETKIIPLKEAEGFDEDKRPYYKILGTVPAGVADANTFDDWFEVEDLYYDPNTHFYIKVDEEFGFSMMPIVSPGDLVLCSYTAPAKKGDLVAALYDETKGALKILSENPRFSSDWVLTSYNQSLEPLYIPKSKSKIFKVVLIKKSK